MLDFLSMFAHPLDQKIRRLFRVILGTALLVMPIGPVVAASTGQLELTVIDKDTGRPIACRMHLIGPRKRPFKPQNQNVPYWHDHFVLPGRILLKLPVGNYTFTIERGLEYPQSEGYFTIKHFADDSKQVELHRRVDMAADGWWSGDLEVRRPARDIELLMEADDLHVAEVITWRNDKKPRGAKLPEPSLVRFDGDRFFHLLEAKKGSELKAKKGSELFYRNGPEGAAHKLVLTPFSHTFSHTKPFGWDVPMLAATGGIDSIQVAHTHLCRNGTINDEGDGKPRDRKRYPSHNGNAEWSQEIYFRLLECGLRIPPTAGSGSGESPNPVGYNRVYVHVDGELTYEKWWQQLRAGAVVVTNGPLMKPSVNGRLPGHVFQAEAGETIELEIGLTLSTREPVTYLEIIKDGHVHQEVRFDEYAKSGRLPKIRFDRSGWFLIRVVTNQPKTYRFAMTGPYYVEIGHERRISKSAAQFFLDWVYERARQIKLADPQQQQEVLQWHRQARDLWQDLLSKANAE